MVEIQVNPDLSYKPDFERINALSEAAFTKLDRNSETTSFGIHFTTDEEIQMLNAQYRGFDKPTDVLSFEADVYDPENDMTYLGDIIISVPTMLNQAKTADHPEATEMLLLTTHGILHLVGFDHRTEFEKAEMWKLQAQILESINVFPRKLPED